MKPGPRNKTRGLTAASILTLMLAACGPEAPPEAEPVDDATVIEDSAEIVDNSAIPGVTPMAERVAIVGFLNKRNGLTRDLELRPGQRVQIGDAVVRLRACEKSAPWESESWTGAFVQLDVRSRMSGDMERIFSGWLYKESPSLNMVEHPVYDVWPKSCEMSFPDSPGDAAPSEESAEAEESA
jgi:hypothetical protein